MALKEIVEIKNNLDQLNISTHFHKIKEAKQKIENLFNDAIKKTLEYFLMKEEYDGQSDDISYENIEFELKSS